MTKLGIGIMTWQRSDVFNQCINTLAKNNLTDVDVHVWQEGTFCYLTHAVMTDQGSINANRAVFDAADISHKEWHQPPYAIEPTIKKFREIE